ncbi:MAG: DUF3078 domain-containing protein [Calditrichia bacterium]
MKLRFTAIILLIFLMGAMAMAEDKPKLGWTKELVGSINLTQTSFDNWSQGGENSVAWQLNLNGKFVNEQEKYRWANSGKVSFGKIKSGDQETRKSVDEIKLESVLTYKAGLPVEPYVALTGETQMAKGYNYTETDKIVVSDIIDPLYLTQSVGLGFKPNETIMTRLGAALKETISDKYGYADDPDTPDKIETSKVEVGAESVTDFKRKLAENILLTSKLELFSNLKALKDVDVRWDTILSAKVAKYVDVNFNVKLFYDSDISKKRQLKQALAVGLTYSFL